MAYIGLEGVKAKELNGPMVNSMTAMLNALVGNFVAGSAGDKGSICAWLDDEGNYRASFCQWMSEKSAFIGTKSELKKWLKEWFPQQY